MDILKSYFLILRSPRLFWESLQVAAEITFEAGLKCSEKSVTLDPRVEVGMCDYDGATE